MSHKAFQIDTENNQVKWNGKSEWVRRLSVCVCLCVQNIQTE